MPKLPAPYAYSMCFIIGAVGAFDNALNVITAQTLASLEENAAASRIIDSVGVVGLVELKAVGALLAVSLCLVVVRTKYWSAVAVTAAVQMALLCYLCFYIETGSNSYSGIMNFWGDPMLVPRMVFEFYTGH